MIFGMIMYQSQTNTVWPFATFNSCFLTSTIWENCENGHFLAFYGKKMTLRDNSFTPFLTWACVKAKPSLIHYLISITVVLEHQQHKKLWKLPFLRHFMAKNDTEWWQHHLIFGMNMSQSQTNTVWLFATCYSCFFNINNLKNCENGHFYGILRQKMTLNDNSFTWILAWICLRVKLILFDHLPPFTAVL